MMQIAQHMSHTNMLRGMSLGAALSVPRGGDGAVVSDNGQIYDYALANLSPYALYNGSTDGTTLLDQSGNGRDLTKAGTGSIVTGLPAIETGATEAWKFGNLDQSFSMTGDSGLTKAGGFTYIGVIKPEGSHSADFEGLISTGQVGIAFKAAVFGNFNTGGNIWISNWSASIISSVDFYVDYPSIPVLFFIEFRTTGDDTTLLTTNGDTSTELTINTDQFIARDIFLGSYLGGANCALFPTSTVAIINGGVTTQQKIDMLALL